MAKNEPISNSPNKKPPLFLGLDAGGNKTDAWICDSQGNILGHSQTGCGNHQVDLTTARDNIYTAVKNALTMANTSQEEITFAFFGLAGADRKADYLILNPMIEKLGFSNWKIECDTMIAFRAGSKLAYGIVLICGTGVNCAGRSLNGNEIQIGGFGYTYGDFGGGHDLAIEAFRTVIRSWEGREPKTELTSLLLSKLNYPNVESMRDDFLDNPKKIPQTIVPSLLELATKGDVCSQAIIRHQAQELAISAKSAIRQLGLSKLPFDVVLAGSILTKEPGNLLFDIIEKEVHSIAPLANIIRLSSPPVIGAILRAMDESDVPICDEILENLQKYTSFY